MARCPEARRSELDCLDQALRGLGVAHCEAIVDLAAGHGFVTDHLVRYLGPGGRAYAVDESAEMLRYVPRHPQIEHCAGKLGDLSFVRDDCVDLAVTFASFHHVNNKNQVLDEVARVLRRGGIVIISDVCDETPTQRFFDSVVRDHSETGHETDFLTAQWLALLAARSKLEHVSSTLEPTPWRFASLQEMAAFMDDLFGLTMDREALVEAIHECLPVRAMPHSDEVELGWSQGFHVLRKRVA